MSHLLSTVNPEAAALIRPEPAAPRQPDVGDVVIYHMRHGHGRSGRTRFPALVLGQGERGTLNLTVFIDAGDFVDEQFVAPVGVGQEFHCWEWPEDKGRVAGIHGTVAALHERIGELEAKMTRLWDCVLGDFDVPKISLIAILQDFENRLRDKVAKKGK